MQHAVRVKFERLFTLIRDMRLSASATLLILSLLILNTFSLAFETDQYHLSPVPLGDIGDEVTLYVEQNLLAAVSTVNAEIAFEEACLSSMGHLPRCSSPPDSAKKLAHLRSNDAVAREVFRLIGDGSLFVTKTGKWFDEHKFSASPDRFKVSYADSIYFFKPSNQLTLSPTVRMYGVELGTDKIEHFFQQGYDYYKIRSSESAKGRSAEEADRKAVAWGQRTERTYFGLLVSGVYSNADLFANFAGMNFYQGLTSPVTIGSSTRPAILRLVNGKWQVNDGINLHRVLIRPFISDHMNEALNPSGYAFNLYPTVKRVVRDQACPEWRTLMPAAKKADLEKRSASLETWNGTDYGFARKGYAVPITECFNDQLPISSVTRASAP